MNLTFIEFYFNITDAPVDNADEVVIEFTSVTLLPDEGIDTDSDPVTTSFLIHSLMLKW
ncbi:MAG: DUF4382 domain-containing protein [Gammaproteobacteria bacterium]|nr:DUF4382 domain-containing protein [Gammaproteobacteria bacterium]